MSEVRGYKVFNHDWTCSPDGKPYQYTCPGIFTINDFPIPCKRGFHFCKRAIDCFNHYDFDPENKIAEVIAIGEVIKEGDKCCTNKLQIVREISWSELLALVNAGQKCTGLGNSGRYNSGDWNSGDWNSGDCNSGRYNSGSYNSGDYNSGDWNSGRYNSGDWNSGNCNSGRYNSGDWNCTCYSNGVFCTEVPKILLFNKPSEFTYQKWCETDACFILNKLGKLLNIWVLEVEMTDSEKIAHPEYKTAGGYLKTLNMFDSCKQRWDRLSDYEKDIIKAIPNFDPEIFKKITGIEV